LNNFDPSLNRIDEFPIILMQHDENGAEFMQNYVMNVTDSALRIYENKLMSRNQEDQPLFNIPLSAIASVQEDFDHSYLDLKDGCSSSDTFSSFLSKKFSVKLKNDFLKIFLLEEYHGAGLSNEIKKNIIFDGLYDQDYNDDAYECFHSMEKALYAEHAITDFNEKE
jgi:hypothetical protein